MNKIEIKGEIGWDVLASDIVAQLAQMSGDVLVEISSPGGYIIEGVEMFNALHEYDKGKVIMRNVGQASSMGSYLMLAGDEAEAYDNATYMIHNGITWAFGNHHDLRESADTVESLTMMLAQKYVEKTGKTLEEVKTLLDNESYFFGNEMLEHGFVDRIISTQKDKNRDAAIALSSEKFKACRLSTQQHHADVEPQKIVAKLQGHMKQFENSPKSTQGENMDYSKLTAQMLQDNCPALMKDIRDAAFKEGEDVGKTAGATAEASRIAAIDAESVPGHEAIIAQMKADPTKTATDAILAIYAADKALKAGATKARAEDGANLASQASELHISPADGEEKEAAKKEQEKQAGAAMLSGVKRRGV